jgi:ABC-type transport system involved in cytochrome c biogenesis permease subunit
LFLAVFFLVRLGLSLAFGPEDIGELNFSVWFFVILAFLAFVTPIDTIDVQKFFLPQISYVFVLFHQE